MSLRLNLFICIVLLINISLYAHGKQNPPLPILLQEQIEYDQSFDSLASYGKLLDFPSYEGALKGWWILGNSYSTSNGSDDAGIYSYGTSSLDRDRSLGSMPSGSLLRTSWGVAFRRNSSSSYGNMFGLNISYYGERWSLNKNLSRTIQFDYSIVSYEDYIDDWGKDDQTFGVWLQKDDLSFVSEVGADPTDHLYETHLINSVLLVDDWDEDEVLQLRWAHVNTKGKDDHLSINNFSINMIPIYESNLTNVNSPHLSFVKSFFLALMFVFVGMAIMVVAYLAKRNSHIFANIFGKITKKDRSYDPVQMEVLLEE